MRLVCSCRVRFVAAVEKRVCKNTVEGRDSDGTLLYSFSLPQTSLYALNVFSRCNSRKPDLRSRSSVTEKEKLRATESQDQLQDRLTQSMNTRSDLTANSLRHKLSEKEMTEDDLRDIISARDLSIKTLHAQLSERDNDINKQHALKLVRVKSHMDLRAKLQQSLGQNTALKMKYAESLSRRNGLEEDLIESKKSLNRLQTFINRKGLSMYPLIVPFAVLVHD